MAIISARPKRLYNPFVASIMFVVSPLLALPLIIRGIYERRWSANVLFCIFLGLIAYLTVPYADLYRHYNDYQNAKGTSVIDFFSNLNNVINWFVGFIYVLMASLKIPFDFFRLVQLPVCFYLLTKIFDYQIKTSKRRYNYHEVFLRYIILYLFFDFLFTVLGVRFGLGLCLFLYGSHLYLDKQKRSGVIIYSFFAAIVHSAFAFYSIIIFALYTLKSNRKRTIGIIIILFLLYNVLFETFSFLLGVRADWYFQGADGDYDNSFSAMTGIGSIIYIGMKLSVLPFVYVLFSTKNIISKWQRYGYSWFIITVVFITNPLMLQRSLWGFMAMGVYLLISMEEFCQFKKRLIRLVVLCGVLFTVFNSMNTYGVFLFSRYYRIAYPLPIILSEQYEEEWMNIHIIGWGNEIK